MKLLASFSKYLFVFCLGVASTKFYLSKQEALEKSNEIPRENKVLLKVEKNEEVIDKVEQKISSIKKNEKKDKKEFNDLELIESMRTEVDKSDRQNFNIYTDIANEIDKKEIKGREIDKTYEDNAILITEEGENYTIKKKTSLDGKLQWEEVSHGQGLMTKRYYDDDGRLGTSVITRDGKRIMYTDYSPKKGHIKQRWLYLQNGDLLNAKYRDGVNIAVWKLPYGLDADKKDSWIRVMK